MVIMKRKILKSFIKIVSIITVFIASVLVSDKLMNSGNTDMTTEMGVATLPIVYMNVNDEYVNPLHGYTVDMDGSYLRGEITPLKANREVDILIDTYGAVVSKVGYEVRSKDMQRLIESTEIESYSFEDNMITATLPIKDLIEDETEYMLVIKVTNGAGNVIRYYTRIINKSELYLSEKFQFVKEFSTKTFDKETARELKKYMEPNSEGDNSSFGHVNIHSNNKQLRWGDLQPIVSSEKELHLFEIDSLNACIELDYQVFIKNEYYNVKECFRIKRGNDRIYLMDYDRTMNQVFDEDKNILVNGKILHGILNEDLQHAENEAANVYVFVQQNALYSFNSTNSNLAKIFSFASKEGNDLRTRYDHHRIKILSVDDGGDVSFVVYGYMNRGPHEGEVGVCLYTYDAALNTINEELFIPYKKSFQILNQELQALSYVNIRNMLFVLLDGSIYRINIESKSMEIMASNLDDNRFVSSLDNSMIAWQDGTEITDSTVVNYFSLDDAQPIQIKASEGEVLIPLGFMDHDLVIGKARYSDVTTNMTGSTVVPMYAVQILNINGEVLKEYRRDGVYTVSAVVEDNMITLNRVIWNEESGFFEETISDQIMNNQPESVTKNILSSVVSEEMETTYQVSLAKMPTNDNIKILSPKHILYEGNKDLETDETDTLERYYVYVMGAIEGIYTNPAEAILRAQEDFGVVVDKRDSYIWQGGNRYLSKQIKNIEVVQADESHSTTALCVNEMLKAQGVYLDVRSMLDGKTVTEVLQENIEGATALDLTGCSLDSVYYYISRGIPVLAMVEGGQSVLITGYDSQNTIIYNPADATHDRYGKEICAEWFMNNGNRFTAYVMTKQ